MTDNVSANIDEKRWSKRFMLMVAATLALVTATPASASAAIPCNTFTVSNRGATWSTRLSDDGVWYTIAPGQTSPQRSWNKIQVPSNNKDVLVSASGYYPPQNGTVYHNDGQWYTPAHWNCSTMPDQDPRANGNYWWFWVASDGYHD